MRLAGWLGAMLGLTELQSPECGRTGPTPPPETSPLSHLSHQANTLCEIFSSLKSGLPVFQILVLVPRSEQDGSEAK